MKNTLEALKGRNDVRVELEFKPELDALCIHTIKGEMHYKQCIGMLEITNARDPEYLDRRVALQIGDMP